MGGGVSERTDVVDGQDDRRATSASVSRTMVSGVLSAARGLIVLPLLVPADLAIYRYALSLVSFAALLHAGTLDALIIDGPRLRVGDPSGYRRRLSAARTTCFVGGAFGTIVVLVGMAIEDPPVGVLSVGLLAFGTAAWLPDQFICTRLRAEAHFARFARLDIMTTVASTAAIVVATLVWKLEGLLASVLIANVLVTWLARDQLRIPPDGVGSAAGPGLRRGLKLFASGFFGEALDSLDMLLFTWLAITDRTELGLYAFGIVAVRAVTPLANAKAQIDMVRISEAYGRPADDADRRSAIVANAVIRDVLLTCLLCCLVATVLGLVVGPLLDNYSASVGATGLLLLTVPLRRYRKYGAHVLALTDRLVWLNASSAAGVVTLVAGALALTIQSPVAAAAAALVRLLAELVATALLLVSGRASATRADARRIRRSSTLR